MRKYIIYAGNFDFPTNNAAAHRVLGNAKALRELGYTTYFVGNNITCRKEDKINNNTYYYEGFEYTQRKNRNTNFLHKYYSWEYLFPVIEKIGVENIKAIISYHYPSVASLRLMKYCEKNDIEYIPDCTEWYDPKEIYGGFFSLGTLDSSIRMRFVHKKTKKIIVISQYLENYYKKANKNIVVIPPLIDLTEKKWPKIKKKMDYSTINFCYAGNPGKKDLLPEIIQALHFLLVNCNKFKMRIVGVTKDQFLKSYPELKIILRELDTKIVFKGRIKNEEAVKIIAESDYSILLRPIKKSTMAGFPTKFVESLACGTPVISNFTSDIKEYLIEDVNGFSVQGNDPYTLSKILLKACQVSPEAREMMKNNAKITALKQFDFTNFKKQFARLIENNI